MAHWYQEQLDFISAVTKMLNQNMPAIYGIENSGLHIHVELREDQTFRKFGEWTDEIAHDCWAYMDKEES